MSLFNIADEVGATYRADVNLALAALAGGNTAWTRAATTTLGTTTNGTLSDTSTTITAFNGDAGVIYHVRCLGAGSITHHATNLIITQGLADITTAAGDTFDVEMLTATTSRIKNYVRAYVPDELGRNQTWQNVTASRTLGTTYTNTTGKPIQVNVCAHSATAGTSLSLTVDGLGVAYSSNPGTASDYNFVSAIVPNGSTYVANMGSSPTVLSWAELR